MNVSTPSRLTDIHLPDMPERPTFEMPRIRDARHRCPEGTDCQQRPPSASSARLARAGRTPWEPPSCLLAPRSSR